MFGLVAFAASSPAAGYIVKNFKTFEYPGASHTEVTGIFGNTVVGNYYYGDYGNYHGFIYDGSTFKNLDYPNSAETDIIGANGNTVVGNWYAAGGGPNRGFVYDGSNFTSLDGPGAYSTIVDGMFGNNLVGWYASNTDTKAHLFIYDGSTFKTETADFPSGAVPQAHTVPTNAVIVSNRDFAVNANNFIYDGSAFYRLDHPGNPYYSDLRGVSGGLVIGLYSNLPDYPTSHYFISDGVTFWELALPDTAGVLGISGHTVYGLYFGDSPTFRGFTAEIAEARLGASVTTSNTMVISWPFPSPGWALQQNSDMTGTNWVTPPEVISNDGTNNFITVNTASGNRFFRLQQN